MAKTVEDNKVGQGRPCLVVIILAHNTNTSLAEREKALNTSGWKQSTNIAGVK